MLPRLNAWDHNLANTYQKLNKGAHDGHRGPLRDLVSQTRKLTDAIGSRLT